MSALGRISFELIASPSGEFQAVRVQRDALRFAPLGSGLVPDQLASLVSRLGLAERILVDDTALIFCRETTPAGTRIPRGIRLFMYA